MLAGEERWRGKRGEVCNARKLGGGGWSVNRSAYVCEKEGKEGLTRII